MRRKPQDPVSRRDEALAFVASDDDLATAGRGSRTIAVVLVETTDAVNVGGVVRAMANTGFLDLRLVRAGRASTRGRWPASPTTRSTSSRPRRTSNRCEAAVADRHFVLGLDGHPPSGRTQRLGLRGGDGDGRPRPRANGQQVALVFGREDRGLSNTMLDACHAVTTIPTNPAYPSLNLAQAALLVLYQLFQRSGGAAAGLSTASRSRAARPRQPARGPVCRPGARARRHRLPGPALARPHPALAAGGAVSGAPGRARSLADARGGDRGAQVPAAQGRHLRDRARRLRSRE